MMDKETQEEELAKSFENIRADKANIIQKFGIRMVTGEAVLKDFESRNSEAVSEEKAWEEARWEEGRNRCTSHFEEYVRYSDRLISMYTPINPSTFGSEYALKFDNYYQSLIVFPEDRPLLEDLKSNNLWYLFQDLSDAVVWLDDVIGHGQPSEDYSASLRDIQDCLDEVESQVERMQNAISEIEANQRG